MQDETVGEKITSQNGVEPNNGLTNGQEQPQKPQDSPQTDVLKLENERSLRCGLCGRHMISIVTNHAILQGTCQRKTCKKINKFYIHGNKMENEYFDKPEIARF